MSGLRLELAEKRFAGAPVLGRLSLGVEPGETLAILGPSGVGKSTLLRICAGLDDGFDGRLQRPGRVAMAFQNPMLLPWRTAAQNIRIATGAEPGPALAEVGLAGREDAFPGQLSLGQQRRLALARALAARPELLVLDEPFVSLDERTAAEMVALAGRLLARLRPAAILVTHDIAEAAALADRAVVLGGSPARIVAEGPVSRGDAAGLRALAAA